jgi:hypothetical protein
MFKRRAPYASIRFSYHAKSNPNQLTEKVHVLQKEGYSVGIWGLDHPNMKMANALIAYECSELGIDFRVKEYLDKKHGTYKYPEAITGKHGYPVWCRPSELLVAPDGNVFPCHHFLYSNSPVFSSTRNSDGLSYKMCMCYDYGLCNPCDVKLKTNRFQQGGHCSVEIEKCK